MRVGDIKEESKSLHLLMKTKKQKSDQDRRLETVYKSNHLFLFFQEFLCFDYQADWGYSLFT